MKRVALLLTVVGALLSILAGMRYIMTSEFMPYHAEVVGKAWTQVEFRTQAIILGMLRIIGASFIACGVTQLWLIPPLQAGQRWACWASLTLALLIWGPTQYVTLFLRTVVPDAQTPVGATAVVLSALLLGSLAHFYVLRKLRKKKSPFIE